MPYTPHTEADVREMLATIGVSSIEELFQDVPEELRLNGQLDIPSRLDEDRLFRHLAELSSRNVNMVETTCFLGAGIYDRFVPASVGAVISRGEFLTAYTPYQPELSQGYLQTIYEFQSMVAELYGMDLANASMYDGATAMAEAAIMCHGINGRNTFFVSGGVHPHSREVLDTYAWSLGLKVAELPLTGGATTDFSALNEDAACVIVQYPNFLGTIEDLKAAAKAAHDIGALFVVVADPTACAILPPPGELGADVVVGEGQPLGIMMGFGGPMLGLFATKLEHIRRIPGRIVGRTTDHADRVGYVMTMRTREQDIRREKATSNICTNEALMALAATVYMIALGKNGMRSVAETSVRNTQYAMKALSEAGASVKFPDKVFCEFVLDLGRPADEVRDALLKENILAGHPLGGFDSALANCLLVAVTETRTKAEIDHFALCLQRILQ